MIQSFEEITDFVYEYHDMMVENRPELYDTNDLDCLRNAFTEIILEQTVMMLFENPGMTVGDAVTKVIGSSDETLQGWYDDAVQLTLFGCCL